MALLFHSKAGADVLMLNADAEAVLRALGREMARDGIFLPEQVDPALQLFAAAVGRVPPAGAGDGEAPEDPPPGLAQRAWPLLQLLRAAAAQGVPVTWSPA